MANPTLCMADGWNYRGHPDTTDQVRCMCTVEYPDTGRVVVILFWDTPNGRWWNGTTPTLGRVIAWRPLPDAAEGRFVHGRLILNGEETA